jgi:hypothetical protein
MLRKYPGCYLPVKGVSVRIDNYAASLAKGLSTVPS